MFSAESVEWETPQIIFDYLDNIYRFTLDPCCHKKTAKCKKFYTKQDDGLSKSWKGETVFMNPPYGREISKWIMKAWEESEMDDITIVCLVPARTDTKWWHNYCMFADKITFIKGRLKFNKWKYVYTSSGKRYINIVDTNSAPFPSAIVVFNGSLSRTTYKSFDWRELE